MNHQIKLVAAAGLAMLFNVTNATVLDEVIVTATKRGQNVQDVGISVTALSGEQTEALGLDTTQEIIQQIPGLQVQSFTPGFTTFNLRGISQNNFQDNLEAPVAVYVDDIYFGSMNAVNMQMFDMTATEVLRGPQGTLFGRNATGGLIHFRTRKADEDEFNGYAKASFGERNNNVIEGAVGGALSDSVRGRIAGRWEQADGYVEAGSVPAGVLGPTGFTATGSDAIGADGFVLRGNLQIDISDSTSLDLSATRTEDDDVPSGHYVVRFTGADPDTLFGLENGPVITGDVHRHASDVTDTGLDRDSTVLSFHLRHEFDSGMQLDYIGGFQDVYKFNKEDAGGGLLFFPFSTEADYEQQSHEFRLSGETESLRWQSGLYLLDIDFVGQARTGGPAIIGDPTGVVIQDTDVSSENWSIFSEVELDLSDSLTLIAGARWSQDDKEINFVNTASNFSAAAGLPDGTVLFDLQSAISESANPEHAKVDEIDYGDVAARLQLNYQVDDTLMYASINRGIKGGNWSPSSAVSLDDFRHDEEDLMAYELGYKTTVLNGTGRLNASIFYYDYSDYQAFSLSGGTPQVTNSDASASGGEVEFAYMPNDHWDFNFGLAYMDSEVDFIPGVIPGSGNTDVELPQAPSLSANLLVRYNTDLASGGNLALQLDGNWNDDHYMEGSNSIASVQEAYTVVNFRTSYTMDNWEVSAWVRNLTDEEYLLYNLDIGFFGFVEQVYSPPRQAGLSLSMDF